jgi:hypothetical protein
MPNGSRSLAASLNYLLTSHVWRQDHNGFSLKRGIKTRDLRVASKRDGTHAIGGRMMTLGVSAVSLMVEIGRTYAPVDRSDFEYYLA